MIGVLEEPGHVVEHGEGHDEEYTKPSSFGRAEGSGLEWMTDDDEPFDGDEHGQVD